MSPQPTSIWDLEDDKHQRYRRWEWFVERCGMAVGATVVVAALLGTLGPGLLTHRITTSSDGLLSVEHHTIQRYQAPAQLIIGCPAPPTGTGIIRLHVSRSFTDRVALEQIAPEPEVTELTKTHLLYSFRASDLTGSGKILFRFRHDKYGAARYTVEVDGLKTQLSEFVLP